MAKNKEKRLRENWENSLIRKYGIDVNYYNKLLQYQNGVCALCLGKDRKRLAVDYNHTLGRVRGLLCSKCKYVILGMIEKSPDYEFRLFMYGKYKFPWELKNDSTK